MTTHLYRRTLISATVAALLGGGAMLRYPGGTALDHATRGYSPTLNFLSDLGMTVAWDGQPNAMGALLFVASLAVLVVGLGGALWGFVRLYSTTRRARLLARAALAVGLVVCVAFLGVALTPENRMMALHVRLTLFAFRVFPGVSLLLALSAHASGLAPRRVVAAWGVLTAVLVGYVILLGWGPSLQTTSGLTTYVIAQKVVTAAAILVIVYQSRASGVGVQCRGLFWYAERHGEGLVSRL